MHVAAEESNSIVCTLIAIMLLNHGASSCAVIEAKRRLTRFVVGMEPGLERRRGTIGTNQQIHQISQRISVLCMLDGWCLILCGGFGTSVELHHAGGWMKYCAIYC